MAKKGVLTTADYLPYEDYKMLLQKLRSDENYRDELYFVVAFSTALRVSDLLNLRWCDILDKQKITVTEQKTGKARSITLNETVKNRIKEIYDLMGKPYPPFFLFKNSVSANITKQAINKRLKALKDKYDLKIDNFSTHSLRKTFGRFVYEKNNKSEEGLLLLCKIFNHSNPRITMAYIGLTDDCIQGVFNCIEF